MNCEFTTKYERTSCREKTWYWWEPQGSVCCCLGLLLDMSDPQRSPEVSLIFSLISFSSGILCLYCCHCWVLMLQPYHITLHYIQVSWSYLYIYEYIYNTLLIIGSWCPPSLLYNIYIYTRSWCPYIQLLLLMPFQTRSPLKYSRTDINVI